MSQRFLDALRSRRVLLMDGAMGTELQRAGLAEGECAARWNLDQPERVRAVHKAYVEAGADVLVANTFQAHPDALAQAGVTASTEHVVIEALRLAYRNCAPHHFVLAGIGPFLPPGSGAPLDPNVLKSFGLALRCADAVLFETWSDPVCLELAAALRWQDRALEDQPILLSLTFQRHTDWDNSCHYRSLDGQHEPEWYARQAREKGYAALGVNCGRDLGLGDYARILRSYRRETNLPLFARPNAGTPLRQEIGWRYPETPATMAAAVPELLNAEASMVGGCCGTTPAHIAAYKALLNSWNAQRPRKSI